MLKSASNTVTALDACHIVGRLGVWDITLGAGQIVDLSPSLAQHASRVIMPLMADAHVHLDKTFTVERTGYDAATLFDAIDRMHADKPNWTEDDLRRRAERAMNKAWHYGVGAMRTHVDWEDENAPTAWGVLQEVKQAWRGKIELQLTPLAPIDLYESCGESIAKYAQKGDGIFGAFIYQNADLDAKVSNFFKLARQYDLALDFHVDEGLDPEAQGFDAIVAEGEKSPELQMLCGHCCSLSVRPQADVAMILQRAARLNLWMAALPTTNLFLQDTVAGRSPRLRGMAPIIEAQNAGIPVILASDNVRDVFYPYGDYDMLDVYRLGVQLGHLNPWQWLESIGARAWGAMGLSMSELAVGDSADFIELEDVDIAAALSKPALERVVWRAGERILE